MNKETKVGLLVGLSFIVLFGVILSGRAPDLPAAPEKTMVSQAPRQHTDSVQVVRTLELPSLPNQPLPSLANVIDAANPAGQRADTAGEPTAPTEPAVVDAGQLANQTEGSNSAHVLETPVPPADAELTSEPSTNVLADAGEPNPDEDLDIPLPPGQQDEEIISYTVKKGDSLYKIAKALCGDASNKTMDRIYEANRKTIPNKKTLVVGKTLNIPVLKKDKNTEALLQSGKFEQVAHMRAGKHQEPAETAAPGDLPPATESTKVTHVTGTMEITRDSTKSAGTPELAKPAARPAPNNVRPAPKGIKSDPKDALAETIEQVTQEVAEIRKDADSQTPATAMAMTATMPKEATRHYQVQKGDTWYKLAAKFMGDSKRWQELYALNDDIIPNKTLLRTGVKIRVPVKGRLVSDTVE